MSRRFPFRIWMSSLLVLIAALAIHAVIGYGLVRPEITSWMTNWSLKSTEWAALGTETKLSQWQTRVQNQSSVVKLLTPVQATNAADELLSISHFSVTFPEMGSIEVFSRDPKYLERYGVSAAEFESKKRAVLAASVKSGELVKDIATAPFWRNSSPLLGLPVLTFFEIEKKEGGIEVWVFDFKADALMALVDRGEDLEVLIVDGLGRTFLSSSIDRMRSSEANTDFDFSKSALDQKRSTTKLVKDRDGQIQVLAQEFGSSLGQRFFAVSMMRFNPEMDAMKRWGYSLVILVLISGILLYFLTKPGSYVTPSGMPEEERRERIRISGTREEALLSLEVMIQILKGWRMAFERGGWDGLAKDLKRPTKDGKVLLEEDLDNLDLIADSFGKELKIREEIKK